MSLSPLFVGFIFCHVVASASNRDLSSTSGLASAQLHFMISPFRSAEQHTISFAFDSPHRIFCPMLVDLDSMKPTPRTNRRDTSRATTAKRIENKMPWFCVQANEVLGEPRRFGRRVHVGGWQDLGPLLGWPENILDVFPVGVPSHFDAFPERNEHHLVTASIAPTHAHRTFVPYHLLAELQVLVND